jgi:hypothetical protein
MKFLFRLIYRRPEKVDSDALTYISGLIREQMILNFNDPGANYMFEVILDFLDCFRYI